MSNWHIKKAIQIINHGGVISYPTESVFGLGCDPLDQEAVLYLLQLKRRSLAKGLLLVAQNVSQLEPYIDINDTLTINKLKQHTDKPVTWIVPCKQSTPFWLTGEHQSIAVRISRHPIVQQLCLQFNGAIVSTSANITGQSSARKSWVVRKSFGKTLDYYVPGELGAFKTESEIRNSITGEVVRT
ncbi:MAG: L-threonylcarbamoyladenylate synthase [Gammaproteobacteria bacterium]